MARVQRRGPMERPARDQDDGSREREGDPLPSVELGCRHHRDHGERHRERDRGAEPQERRAEPVALGGRRLARQRCSVARLLDGAEEVREPDDGRIELHGGLLSAEVDAGPDASEIIEPLLDAYSARGARHALDLQVDPCRIRGGHGSS